MSSHLTKDGVPNRRERARARNSLTPASDVCDHLQAAMFHLSNHRGDVAQRTLRAAAAAYSEMQSRGNAIPGELDQAVAAGLAFVARPCDPRALVALCQATLVLMEWRSLRFAETRYLPSEARLAETS